MAPLISATPPMMTMTSAFRVKMMPIEASVVRKALIEAPPAAVTAPPSENASAEARGTLMPTRPADMGSTATARSARPARVLLSQTYRIAASAADTRNAATRLRP